MLNLGMEQKAEGTHGRQNGSDREPEPEEKLEGEECLSCIQYKSSFKRFRHLLQHAFNTVVEPNVGGV